MNFLLTALISGKWRDKQRKNEMPDVLSSGYEDRMSGAFFVNQKSKPCSSDLSCTVPCQQYDLFESITGKYFSDGGNRIGRGFPYFIFSHTRQSHGNIRIAELHSAFPDFFAGHMKRGDLCLFLQDLCAVFLDTAMIAIRPSAFSSSCLIKSIPSRQEGWQPEVRIA